MNTACSLLQFIDQINVVTLVKWIPYSTSTTLHFLLFTFSLVLNTFPCMLHLTWRHSFTVKITLNINIFTVWKTQPVNISFYLLNKTWYFTAEKVLKPGLSPWYRVKFFCLNKRVKLCQKSEVNLPFKKEVLCSIHNHVHFVIIHIIVLEYCM